MKHYLIALYIPWMFFFLAGCYSSRQLTYEELKSYNEKKEISIVSKKRQEFILVDSESKIGKKQGCLYCTEWEVSNDNVKMTCLTPEMVRATANSPGSKIVPGQEVYTLLKSDIALISKEEFDTISTVILIGIPIVILTSLIILFKSNGFMSMGSFGNSGYTGN